MKDFYQAVKNRRSFYSISNNPVVPDERIREVIEQALLHAPSAFHSQSGRILLLLGKEHETLWDMTVEVLKSIVDKEQYASTDKKIKSFKAGYGTVLFFEDQSVVKALQNDYPTYRDNFPIWSLEASGMLQYIVWTSLEVDGWGASLQHYNPLIDEAVRNKWRVPDHWLLLGQMPFGKPTAEPDEKDFDPVEDRIRVYP